VGYTSSASGMNVSIPENDNSYVKGATGEWIHVLQRPNIDVIKNQLENIYKLGIRSVAVCLMHSFTFSGPIWSHFLFPKFNVDLIFRPRRIDWETCHSDGLH
jgi:hypothetical protein